MPPICIQCDFNLLIGKVQNSMDNGKYRHIHRKHNTIRLLLLIGVISVDYIRSKDNITDLETKWLN